MNNPTILSQHARTQSSIEAFLLQVVLLEVIIANLFRIQGTILSIFPVLKQLCQQGLHCILLTFVTFFGAALALVRTGEDWALRKFSMPLLSTYWKICVFLQIETFFQSITDASHKEVVTFSNYKSTSDFRFETNPQTTWIILLNCSVLTRIIIQFYVLFSKAIVQSQ